MAGGNSGWSCHPLAASLARLLEETPIASWVSPAAPAAARRRIELQVPGCGSTSRTWRSKASGTSASAVPTRRGSVAAAPAAASTGHPPVRFLEIDVARRGVERRPAARREIGAQELIDPCRRPLVPRPGTTATRSPPRPRAAPAGSDSWGATSRSSGAPGGCAARPARAPAARGARRDRAAAARPPDATRPPMLLPIRWARSSSSASSSATIVPGEEAGVVRSSDRLDRVAEAGQVSAMQWCVPASAASVSRTDLGRSEPVDHHYGRAVPRLADRQRTDRRLDRAKAQPVLPRPRRSRPGTRRQGAGRHRCSSGRAEMPPSARRSSAIPCHVAASALSSASGRAPAAGWIRGISPPSRTSKASLAAPWTRTTPLVVPDRTSRGRTETSACSASGGVSITADLR